MFCRAETFSEILPNSPKLKLLKENKQSKLELVKTWIIGATFFKKGVPGLKQKNMSFID